MEIKAIKGHGGLTIAQVPDPGPKHTGMPNSAIASSLVDVVLPIDRIAEALSLFARDVAVSRAAPSQATLDVDLKDQTTTLCQCRPRARRRRSGPLVLADDGVDPASAPCSKHGVGLKLLAGLVAQAEGGPQAASPPRVRMTVTFPHNEAGITVAGANPW